jgi:hypothetical protein
MTSLLYPAVLGTILYTFGERAWDVGVSAFVAHEPEPYLGFALLLLFTFDYAYTLNGNVRGDYGGFAFSIDCLILVLLFVVGKGILSKPSSVWNGLTALMIAVKLLSVLFEISRLPDPRSSMETLAGWRNYETDAALLLVYLAVLPLMLLLPEAWPWALALVMLIDAGTYFKRSK